jgi:hypothetical protein
VIFSDRLPIYAAIRAYVDGGGSLAHIAAIELGDQQWAAVADAVQADVVTSATIDVLEGDDETLWRLPCVHVEAPDYIGIRERHDAPETR